MRVFLLITLSIVGRAAAWSAPPTVKDNSISRRGLLQGGVATAIVAGSSLPANAGGSSVYIPPPNSMDGKLVLITGGNTGLGLESAKRLAAAGADIIVTTRTEAKGQQAVLDIVDYLKENGAPATSIRYAVLDLANLKQIDEFSNENLPKLLANSKIDVLMNNAGVMAIPDRQLTVDGFERTFQTNHLGHFAMTAKIAPKLADKAKIINVSSEAHKFAGNGLELDNLQGEREYGPWSSYGLSKLENILFTKELQSRASEAGKDWTVTCLHPGAVATDLGRYLVGEEKWNDMKENGMSFTDALLFVPLSKFTKTVQDGASTQVYLAVNDDAVGGEYYLNTNKDTRLSGAPIDRQAAKDLWKVSEELSKTKFSF